MDGLKYRELLSGGVLNISGHDWPLVPETFKQAYSGSYLLRQPIQPTNMVIN